MGRFVKCDDSSVKRDALPGSASRVVRREGGVRIYAGHAHGMEPKSDAERQKRIDALVDVAVQVYAPLTGACITDLVRRLRFAVPQWRSQLQEALRRAKVTIGTHPHRRRRLVLAIGREPSSI